MLDTRLEIDQCPYCEKELDAATSILGNNTPSPGDICLCIGCAQVLVFDDTLKLREPKPEEYREANKMEAIKRGQEAIRMLDRRER